ncbi:hypothetical protein [Prosthecobacter sp.]|uniref:hypothetical protein n=1 Tax=Prosthecobacter sp. TaxID=1965333 RepID=UPI0037845148
MNPRTLRTTAINLRARARTEENAERAAAWTKEADELDAKAAELEKQAPAAPPAKAK